MIQPRRTTSPISRLANAVNSASNLRMICGDYNWIWQLPAWHRADHPGWTYDAGALATPLVAASQVQGRLLGRLADVGMALRDQASLAALTQDVLDNTHLMPCWQKRASGNNGPARP